MQIILASGEFKIMSEKTQKGTLYGVFMNNKLIDKFAEYKHAQKLTQDLFVARATTADDLLIGSTKFCPSPVDNGQLVTVVAKTNNGYIVQPLGTHADARLEVAPDALSDPPPAW